MLRFSGDTGKDQALTDWLSSAGLPVLFDPERDERDPLALIPSWMGAVVKTYRDGSVCKKYDMTFRLLVSPEQAEDMDTLHQWQDWMDAQRQDGHYPDFGPLCRDYQFEDPTNGPRLTVAYSEGSAAVCQLAITLFYWEAP